MRYDVYAFEGGFVLDVQSDLLGVLNTRVVVPLLRPDNAPKPASRLNPTFKIDGADHIMVTQFMAAVPVSALGEPAANLSAQHDQIVAALDMVFLGF